MNINNKLAGMGPPDPALPLAGKRWAALGSSITAQGYYTSVVQAMSGMVLTNLGCSGGSLGQGSGAGATHYGCQKIYDSIASIPLDTQIVTLECGANDFATALVPLGALGDTTLATFYGALYKAATDIHGRVPNAKLVFLTPYGAGSNTPTYSVFATNTNGNKLVQFQQAIVDVANFLGVPCLDVGRQGGIGYLNANSLTRDGLHIQAAGGLIHGTYDYAEMQRLATQGYFG